MIDRQRDANTQIEPPAIAHIMLCVRRLVASAILVVVVNAIGPSISTAADTPPNVVIIFADDLGYGDLGCYGHPTIRTPHLDRMAAEGLRFTQFYVAECVCTPSRAALLTGRLPIRSGMCSDKRRVLFPNSGGGLPANEVTIAEVLKRRGYATACIGKWHLGHLPQFLPTKQGFDEYFGIPYSNDMGRVPTAPRGRQAMLEPRSEYWDAPILRGEDVVERPADQTTLTKRYTEEAVRFITANKDKPFFLYLPHNLPHVPLFRSRAFEGVSARGLYGDVVEEVDWSVGQVLDTLRNLKLDERTFVFFTSDNGPWLTQGEQGGSAGLLREGKGSTWEGGMREPGIAWWPGRVPAGVVTQELGATLDLLPTIAQIADAPIPAARPLDGYDLSPVLFDGAKSPRDTVYYYRGTQLMALRQGPWKAHFITQPGYGDEIPEQHDPPLLFHLEHDPSERFNVAPDHPDVLATIQKVAATHRATITPVPSQLEIPLPQ